MYSILFKAAAETLHALAATNKYLGANIGFIAVLHTWGQNLLDHPHLHIVVPAGGINNDQSQWKTTPYEDFLFPVTVVSRLFRGKFLDMFRRAVDEGEIGFHGTLQQFETDPKSFRRLIDTLYKTDWVVYAKPPFAGPKAVLKYLGRYTHRIAISNNRLTQLTEQTVSFTWKDYADKNRKKVMTLTHGEFIRRFLLHVLPTGFVRIRYFGFLGQAVKKEKLQRCRTLLGEKPIEPEPENSDNNEGEEVIKELWSEERFRCPACKKGRLVPYRRIPRSHQRNIEMAAVA
jgi:hypothetical protein